MANPLAAHQTVDKRKYRYARRVELLYRRHHRFGIGGDKQYRVGSRGGDGLRYQRLLFTRMVRYHGHVVRDARTQARGHAVRAQSCGGIRGVFTILGKHGQRCHEAKNLSLSSVSPNCASSSCRRRAGRARGKSL